MYNSDWFEVYNLWYAYMVMKCFTTTKKTYNAQMACKLTRISNQVADSISCEVFTLVWVVYQLTKINKYNK